MVTQDEITEALRQVEDPELGMDIVEIGPVYDIEVSAGNVKVTHSLTSPACPLGPMIQEGIRHAVRALPGVEHVEIELTWEPNLGRQRGCPTTPNSSSGSATDPRRYDNIPATQPRTPAGHHSVATGQTPGT